MAIKHSSDKAANKLTLDDILNGPDEFGLLEVEYKTVGAQAPIEVTNFEAISVFYDEYGREPSSDGALAEKLLARRLEGFINNTDLHETLAPYDRYGLLSSASTFSEAVPGVKDEPIHPDNATSLDDIFASAEFSALDLGEESLFHIEHVPEVSADREQPDEIAQRRVCEDFYQFETLFINTQESLKSGEFQTTRFNLTSKLEKGDFFILEGVLGLVDEVGEYREDNEGRYDPRLRLIFENGTESNHLLRSLAKRLYTDETGRRVIQGAESIEDAFNQISHTDKRSGQVYFVTTLSDNPTLKAIPNLIKIGYTEQTVEERTKNAQRDIAFLEAPVRILAATTCFNLNPQRFEALIHGFLHAQRVKITLTGRDGKNYQPREWFSVPLKTAMDVVKYIVDGSIVHYRMDNTTGLLVPKNSSK